MNNREQDYKVKNHNYFVLASIIFLLFILMMTVVDINYFMRKSKENSSMNTKNTLYRLIEEKQTALFPSCLIVAGKHKNDSVEIIEGSLEKSKIRYTSKVKFEDITDDELKSVKIIIINGSEFGSLGNVDMLYEYLKKGKDIIFTSMPDVDYIEAKELKKRRNYLPKRQNH